MCVCVCVPRSGFPPRYAAVACVWAQRLVCGETGLARLKYLGRPLILGRDPPCVTQDTTGGPKPTAAVITGGEQAREWRVVSGGGRRERGTARGEPQ